MVARFENYQNVKRLRKVRMMHAEGLRQWSGKTLHLEVKCADVAGGGKNTKINEASVQWAASTNSVGSLTIMEIGDGRGGENRKTAEIVLVFYDP
jgi:hypothetical protein